MAIFYKIKEDGKSVYVLKTLTNNPRRNTDDIVGFNEISIESFLNKIPKKLKGDFLEEIRKVQTIHDNVFYINRLNVYDPASALTTIVFNINGKAFNVDCDDLIQKEQLNAAISYCCEKYGSEFTSKYRYIFSGFDTQSYSFANKELIGDKEASDISKELYTLTKVYNLKEKIEEYQKIKKKK